MDRAREPTGQQVTHMLVLPRCAVCPIALQALAPCGGCGAGRVPRPRGVHVPVPVRWCGHLRRLLPAGQRARRAVPRRFHLLKPCMRSRAHEDLLFCPVQDFPHPRDGLLPLQNLQHSPVTSHSQMCQLGSGLQRHKCRLRRPYEKHVHTRVPGIPRRPARWCFATGAQEHPEAGAWCLPLSSGRRPPRLAACARRGLNGALRRRKRRRICPRRPHLPLGRRGGWQRQGFQYLGWWRRSLRAGARRIPLPPKLTGRAGASHTRGLPGPEGSRPTGRISAGLARNVLGEPDAQVQVTTTAIDNQATRALFQGRLEQ